MGFINEIYQAFFRECPQQLLLVFEKIGRDESYVLCSFIYPITASVIIRSKNPQYIIRINSGRQHMPERNPRNVQFQKSLFFPLKIIDISIIFYDEQFIIFTFSHVVLIFELGKTSTSLPFGIQLVESVIGLNPQYVFFGFHDTVNQVTRQ